MSKLGEMDAQTQADIKNGRKELHTADFYIRKKLSSGTGIVKLIVETDTLAPGVTNIDKGKLYPGNHLVITAIGLAYGYSASSANVDNGDYSSNIYKINDVAPDDTMVKSDVATASYQGVGVPVRYIPVGIVNSEFTLTAGGKLIFKSRAKKFFAEATSGFAASRSEAVTSASPSLSIGAKDSVSCNANVIEISTPLSFKTTKAELKPGSCAKLICA